MAYLDDTGLNTLWSKIKSNFAHDITASDLTTNGITLSLNSGAKTGGNWNQLATALIPAATNTTGGLVTNAQAQSIANIKSYAAGTGLTLDGTTFNHLTGTGYNHIPEGGSSGKILRWSEDGTAQWGGSAGLTFIINSTYKEYTINNGLTIAPDDGIQFSESRVTGQDMKIGLTSASDTEIGGIKVGDNLSINKSVLSVPTATTSIAGVIKVGDNLSISDGVLSADAADNLFIATYGTTTYAEIVAAYNANKTVLLFDTYNNTKYCSPLSNISSTYCTFYSMSTDRVVRGCSVSTSNTWSNRSTTTLAGTAYANTFNFTNNFTGTITVPTPTADTQATNKSYVDNAIATAISGSSKYGGTVSSKDELLAKDYTTGTYYVVAVASGSTWAGYENGDMFFAHTDKSDAGGSLDDFDCVQTNITAMTDTEINSICKLD